MNQLKYKEQAAELALGGATYSIPETLEFLREAGQRPIADVAEKHGFSDQALRSIPTSSRSRFPAPAARPCDTTRSRIP